MTPCREGEAALRVFLDRIYDLCLIGAYVFDYEMQTLSIESRSLALQVVWGSDSIFNARSMDVFISRLRKYLGDGEQVEIVNVHGRGYKLVVRAA